MKKIREGYNNKNTRILRGEGRNKMSGAAARTGVIRKYNKNNLT